MKKIAFSILALLLLTGWWKTPETKEALLPDRLYSWQTEGSRRVDLAIQDGQLMLYVGDDKQENAFFQLVVKGDKIETFHLVKLGVESASAFSGLNFDTKNAKISKFIVTRAVEGGRAIYAKDTDGDLTLDYEK